MSYKKGTYISLLLFAAVGVLFFVTSLSLSPPPKGQPIGPAYFPRIISALLVICCVISYFTTKKKNEETIINVENIKYMILTITCTILFVVLWKITGSFYVLSYLFLTTLIYVFNQAKHSFKKFLVSSLISIVFILVVYGVFERLFYITF